MPSTGDQTTPNAIGVHVVKIDDPSNEWNRYDMPDDQTPPPATPGQHASAWTSPDGRVTVGLWKRDADVGDLLGADLSFDFLIEGEVTVVEPDGTRHVARSGDLLMYGSGDKGLWEQSEPIKKIFVHVRNSPAEQSADGDA